MGDTFRGTAIPLTNQRTDQMILIISITMVFAFAVGGFVMAANIYGDQDHSPPDDVQQIVKDYFDPAETAPLQILRESGFVMESEIHSHSYRVFSKSYILTLQTKSLNKNPTATKNQSTM
jgi:hypothetical protein